MHIFKSKAGAQDESASASKKAPTPVRQSSKGLESANKGNANRQSKAYPHQLTSPTMTNLALPPPEVNVSWGSLDPSIPKKVSITRRTLHPDSRDPSSDYHFQEILRESLLHPELIAEELDLAIENRQIPSATFRTINSDRTRSLRRSYSTRQPSGSNHSIVDGSVHPATIPLDSPEVPPKKSHHKSRSTTTSSLPLSKFSASANAITRAANQTAILTARESTDTFVSRRSDESELVPLTIDTNSLSHTNSHVSRSDRNAANKRLYQKMKAENHNLWVLLDASNRRVDSMMETLHSEELRCQSLEQRSQQLQNTLDTLNTRRLWQPEQLDTAPPSVCDTSSPRESLHADSADPESEVAQVTAELDSLRQNIVVSRNAIREIKGLASNPTPRMIDTELAGKEYYASQDALERTIHEFLTPPLGPSESVASLAIDQLDLQLQDVIRPKAVRPTRPQTAGAMPEQQRETFATPPSSPPPELDPSRDSMSSHRSSSTRISALSSVFARSTPDLVLAGSDNSDTSSLPPSPPPKSSRRHHPSQMHVHPALRVDTDVGLAKQPIYELTSGFHLESFVEEE